MLPCSKVTNGVYAARYLKHAERNARTVQINSGVKRNIMDGCIIEGKKTGSLLKATVIEPSGTILAAAANFKLYLDHDPFYAFRNLFLCQCGTREAYHPDFPSLDINIKYQREALYDVTKHVIGRDRLRDNIFYQYFLNRMWTPVYCHATEDFIYSVMHSKDAANQSENYLDIYATKTSLSQRGYFEGDTVSIHSAEIKRFSGEYGIDTLGYFARRAKAIAIREGVIVIIAVVGKVIEIIPPTDPERPETSVTQYRETLIRLEVDLKIKENREKRIERGKDYDLVQDRIEPTLTGVLFPQHLIPEDLQPKTIKRWVYEGSDRFLIETPAKTAMTVADIALDANGNVIAAIKYQVKIQVSSEPEWPNQEGFAGENGITVAAYGLASWGDGNSSFFDIHSKEVFTSDDTMSLVTAHGANPDYVLLDNSTNIINGKVVRTAAKLSRKAMGWVSHQSYQLYNFVDPYLVEIIDGVEQNRSDNDPVMGITYGGAGLLYTYGFAVDYERDFYIHSNWVREVNNGNKAYVSKTAVAVPGSSSITLVNHRFMKSTDQGILFVDGDKRRYEQIAPAPDVMEDQHITITCHQKEVRDEDGKLISPCVIVVGAKINGEHSILVRKGPIWDEDFDEEGYSFERYWKVTKALNNNYNFYFYVGNPLMPAGKYGQFFKPELKG